MSCRQISRYVSDIDFGQQRVFRNGCAKNRDLKETQERQLKDSVQRCYLVTWSDFTRLTEPTHVCSHAASKICSSCSVDIVPFRKAGFSKYI